MPRFRPAGFRKWADRMAARLATRWRAACTAAEHRISRGWTAWRRRASRNPAAPRNAVSPWEAGAPRSAASRGEAAANPWLGVIARCSRTGSSNPSPSSRESGELQFLDGAQYQWPRPPPFTHSGSMRGDRLEISDFPGRDAAGHSVPPRRSKGGCAIFVLYGWSPTSCVPTPRRFGVCD
jgi:hypothetical protein